jgi:G3E family GTPase
LISERVAAIVLTGFLGSGKTTLLKRLLDEPAFSNSAVIVNELGEVGLDHDLLAFSADRMVVLPGGCVCCSVREDIEVALRELFQARDAGRIPAFTRLIIETTGVADPLPLLMTLHGNPLALRRLERPQVITVVDGVLGGSTLEGFPEAVRQVANADLVVISKADLAPGDAALPAQIAALNPWAELRRANLLSDPPVELAAFAAAPPGSERRLGGFRCDAVDGAAHGGVRTVSLVLDAPLDWTAFGVWMTLLLHRHGQGVLRVKGLLDVQGLPGPVLFQSAQHLVHPPQHLEAWPSSDRRSRIVFIVRDLAVETLRDSLAAFNAAATRLTSKPQDYKLAGAGGSIAGRPVRRATAPRWMKG